MVDQNSDSWNQVSDWLQRLDLLQHPPDRPSIRRPEPSPPQPDCLRSGGGCRVGSRLASTLSSGRESTPRENRHVEYVERVRRAKAWLAREPRRGIVRRVPVQ
jgi:hypothetical protein